jgi:futalosine hydrolase
LRTLLLVATQREINPFLTQMQVNKPEEFLYTTPFVHFGDVDIFITGIGIPFAMFHLINFIHQKEYNLVINAGVAGSYNTKMYPVGSVVNVVREEFADIGIEDKQMFYTIFENKWLEMDFPPFKNGKLHNEHKLFPMIEKIPAVNSITVNRSSGMLDTIEMFRKKFNPDIENMEGAAVFYVCLNKKIPFLEIRSISNFVEERDTKKWNIESAVQNLNQFLIDLFNTSKHQ